MLSLSEAFGSEARHSFVSIALYASTIAVLMTVIESRVVIMVIFCALLAVYQRWTNMYARTRCEAYVNECLAKDMKDIQAHYMQPRKRFWVAVQDGVSLLHCLHSGEIVGTLGLDAKSEKLAELRRMFVSEKVRRQGISKLLLLAFNDFAKSNGYEEIILTTTTAQKAAVQMYHKNGYHLVTRRPIDWLGAFVEIDLGKRVECKCNSKQ